MKIKSVIFLISSLYIISNQPKIYALNQVNEQPLELNPNYGRSQSNEFINAIYGPGLDRNINDKEIFNMYNSIPADNNHKFFLRFGANNGTSYLTRIKNASNNQILTNAIVATTNQATSSKYGGELAFGYKWNRSYLELEFIMTENMKYNPKILFSNLGGSLNSTVKANAILINTYYDFADFNKFKLFFGIGCGAGINRANSNFFNNPVLFDGENFTKRTIAGSYNLLLGFRINIVPQLFIIATIRYTNFAGINSTKYTSINNLVWQDELQNVKLTGQHTLIGFSFNLMHVFI